MEKLIFRQYQKINTLYKRNSNNKNKLIIGDFSLPEFEYLYNNLWLCYEKCDGTNSLVCWDGYTRELHGKTENADVPKHLLKKMDELFTIEKLRKAFPIKYDELGNEIPFIVRIYGEGYGVKIQKGGNYIPDDCDFRLFDVQVGNWWLQPDDLQKVADDLEINMCPLIGIMTLKEAEELVIKGFKSTFAHNKDYDAEGLVCRPMVQLFNRSGQRVLCKIKTVDYRKLGM